MKEKYNRIQLKYRPTERQLEAHEATESYIMFGGAVGGGKAQPLDSKILTPFGWKRMGDVHVNDQLIDPSTGGSCRVLAVHPQGMRQTYKITFDDDSSTTVDEDHLWAFHKVGHKKPGRKNSVQREYAKRNLHSNGRPNSRWDLLTVHNTREIKRLFKSGVSIRIPLTEPVQFAVNGRTGKTAIRPYTLGVLLGDGNIKSKTISSPDKEIQKYLVEEDGFHVRKDGHTVYPPTDGKKIIDSWCRNHKLIKKDWYARSWDKFIPQYVFTAPMEYRHEFLRGLMDTDGTSDKRGRCYFCSSSKKLAEGVQELAWSLGAKAKICPKKEPKYTYKGETRTGRPAYVVRIWMPANSDLFRVKIKKDRCTDSWNGGHDVMRQIVSIEYAGIQKTQCITLNTVRGLYITDDYIVTHNTVWLVNDMLQYCLDYRRNRVGIFRWENSVFTETTYKAIEEWILNVPGLVPKGGHNKTEKRIRLFNDSEIIYGGLKPSSSAGGDILSRVKSLELSAAGVDEASEMPEKVWNFLCGRIPRWRAVDQKTNQFVYPPKRVICTSNPEICWVKTRFVDEDNPNHRFIQSLAEDNKYLSKDYISGLKEIFTPEEIERYVKGRWDAVKNVYSIFPAEWVRAAVERELMEDGTDVSFGFDVATHGDDTSVLTMRKGGVVRILDETKKFNTVELEDLVKYYADIHQPDEIVIDYIGPGEGVCDHLINDGYNGRPFVGGERPYEEKFLNRRAEAYWNIRRRLESKEIDLDRDNELENEMANIQVMLDASDRRIKVESKKAFKERIGHSPDKADSVVYAFAENGAGLSICGMA